MDLGDIGQRHIQQKFNLYQEGQAQEGSAAPDPNCRRIMITGFGLFKGIKSNISGAIVRALSNPKIYQAEQSLSRAPYIDAHPNDYLGIVTHTSGVNKWVRTLRIDGVQYQLNLVIFDVLWDFAAAVILSELNTFQPHGLIMMGQGEPGFITLESGARNLSCRLSGFGKSGDPVLENHPRTNHLLDQLPDEVPMSWKNHFLAGEIRSIAKDLGYDLRVPQRSRASNRYICNHVSYAALVAPRINKMRFAGGAIEIEPEIQVAPKTGFLHLPRREDIPAEEMSKWLHLLTRLIYFVPH